MSDAPFMPSRRALLAFVVLSSAALLRADFSGDFSAGTPANHNFEADPNPDLGHWGSTFSKSGGSGGGATIDTLGAPNQIEISATGYPGGTGSIVFYYNSFIIAGTVSFNLTGSVSVRLDGDPITSGGTSYSFAVSPGQTLSFGASATGTMGGPIFGPRGEFLGTTPSVVATNSGMLSDFDFIAIPEPSTYTLVAGACAFGLTVCRRRSRLKNV